MLVSLLLAAASPQSVVEAERGFAAMAQAKGQWTAFRATATPDAIMFLPQASNAQAFLKDRKNPPVSVKWWPTKAWASCDGSLAVTTGGALWPDGKHGWFTTVWKRQDDGGWKWVLDHGGFTDVPRPAPKLVAVVTPAGCKPVIMPAFAAASPAAFSFNEYASADHTLLATARADAAGHVVRVEFAGVNKNDVLLEDRVTALK